MLKWESYPSIFLVTLVDKMINNKEGGKLHTAVSKLTMQAGRYPAPIHQPQKQQEVQT